MVNGISSSCTKADVSYCFSPFGIVTECKLCTPAHDKTPFAIVTFQEEKDCQEAKKAVSENRVELKGATLYLDDDDRTRRYRDKPGRHNEPQSSHLWVGNLPSSCTTRDVVDYFDRFGRVEFVQKLLPQGKNSTKYYTYVYFYHAPDADYCLQRGGKQQILLGQSISVEPAYKDAKNYRRNRSRSRSKSRSRSRSPPPRRIIRSPSPSPGIGAVSHIPTHVQCAHESSPDDDVDCYQQYPWMNYLLQQQQLLYQQQVAAAEVQTVTTPAEEVTPSENRVRIKTTRFFSRFHYQIACSHTITSTSMRGSSSLCMHNNKKHKDKLSCISSNCIFNNKSNTYSSKLQRRSSLKIMQ